MTDQFFNFISETTKENFQSAQQEVFSDNAYNPYSDDLDLIEELLDENKFDEAVNYLSVNVLLSARAHLYKNYALTQLGKEKEAQAELIFAHKILEGISLTGDGTLVKPYLITRISDEKDFLSYLEEVFARQSLVSDNGHFYDVIVTQSERRIYFDITTPYLKMQNLMDDGKMQLSFLDEQVVKEKKWWQFWK